MKNEVLELSFKFAVEVVLFCKELNKLSHDNFVISNQLLKSGTSIGANIEEANGAQSKKDFLAKMFIAYKEARETHYWLKLISESKVCNSNKLVEMQNTSNSLIKLLSKITKSTRDSFEK